MDLDFKNWSDLLDMVWKVGTLLGFLWLALQQRSKANANVLTEHSGRLDTIDKEIIHIKGKIDAQPTDDDLQRLHDRISTVGKEVHEVSNKQSGLTEAVNGLKAGVERLTNHLMGATK